MNHDFDTSESEKERAKRGYPFTNVTCLWHVTLR